MRAMTAARNWREFREEVIELDGRACVRCKKRHADGAVLQVHHKRYIAGRRPWQYVYSDCETLCKGCHAAEHGHIPPPVGWQYDGEDDLGDLAGSCEYCGTALRYVFFISHPKWPALEVGTDCCDSLTGTQLASNHMESINRFVTRRRRFLASSRWKSEGAAHVIRQAQIRVQILAKEGGFGIRMNTLSGKRTYATLDDAKRAAFEVIENGAAHKALTKHAVRQVLGKA